MMNDDIPYIVENSLSIEINVIGYKTQGESIVLFIRVDSNIVFSAVIDSYSYKNINKTMEILKNNKVKQINYLCWTHPDEDHSKGLNEIIKKYVNSNTLINIPENIEVSDYNCSSETVKIFDLLKDNLKLSKKNRYRVYTVSDFKDILVYEKNLKINYHEKEYVIEIKSIAPNSNLIREELRLDTFNKNKHSIALLFYFGNLIFLFGGDMENSTIRQFNKTKIPASFDFIKIPHHGSDSSTALLDFIEKVNISCTTSYIKGCSNNPNKCVMKRYKDISEHVYSTCNIDNGYKGDFGIICTVFDVINQSSKTFLEGDACDYIPN